MSLREFVGGCGVRGLLGGGGGVVTGDGEGDVLLWCLREIGSVESRQVGVGYLYLEVSCHDAHTSS